MAGSAERRAWAVSRGEPAPGPAGCRSACAVEPKFGLAAESTYRRFEMGAGRLIRPKGSR